MKTIIEYIDITSITEKNLIEIIDKNHKTAVFLKEEIKKLQEANKTQPQIKKMPQIETIKQENNIQYIDEDPDEYNFEKEVAYYLEELKKLPINYSEEEILEVLPVISNYNYERIINRLRLEIIKNINEIREFLEEEYESFNKEELKELQIELKSEHKKSLFLKKVLNKEELKNESKPVENKLIFVPTSGGSPRVLEEIKDIPIEYYDGFLGLFQSIKEGTFKGVERFASTNNTVAGISKVKDFKIRVAFDRIDKDKYAVITAFVKKSDNAKSYLVPLQNKIANYRKLTLQLKELVKNDDFLEEQSKYEEELFEILTQKEKERVI